MPNGEPLLVVPPSNRKPNYNPQDPVSFNQVFREELDQIEGSRQARQVCTEKKACDSLIGLAFSGGGIRSATFNLGVLQALARRGLLRNFDYLSTVSGGGYIGSWLAALTLRLNTPDDFTPVEQALKQETYEIGQPGESPFVHWLRKYADYLTPQMGILSPDTAAAVGTWIRNVILNLTVILLFLLGMILLPSTLVLFNWSVLALHPTATFILGAVLIAVATGWMARSMTDFGSDRQEKRSWLGRNRVTVGVMYPFFSAAWLMNTSIWIWQEHGRSLYWIPLGAAFYTLVWVVGFTVLMRRSGNVQDRTESEEEPISRPWLALSALGAGAMAGVLMNVYSWVIGKVPVNYDEIWIVVIGGTVAVVLLILLTGVLQLGLLGTGCHDLIREWWSREGGQLMTSALLWLGAFSIVIFGPLLVRFGLNSTWGRGVNFSAALAWLVSSVVGLIAGRSPDTDGEKKSAMSQTATSLLKSTRVKEVAAKVAPFIFVGGLLVILSTAVHIATGWLFERSLTAQLWFGGCSSSPMPQGGCVVQLFRFGAKPNDTYDTYWAIQSSPNAHWYWILGGAALFGIVAGLLSARIDINDFSMHHFYRNRLVRCYLGATNKERKPQQFTGFDPKDDIPLAALANSPGLYPILNASLNTSSGKELGFEERKAKSFVFTPLYCGYDPSSECYSTNAGYLPTWLGRTGKRGPRKGITLGTAMAISGAAASPNMGHYSSPATAFFMTLFDVRLGWWIGNPRYGDTWKSAGPLLGLAYLLKELVARSNEDSRYVYLSDGGHFENLAIYELVKRRCRLIVACDCGADSKYSCGDLMSAIEKCRTDFGVDIKISLNGIKPEDNCCVSAANFTVGDIYYGPNDVGKLIYLKSSLPVDDVKAPLGARLAAGVRSYWESHHEFPHQSTADQWFDELQFEAYRALGEHIGGVSAQTIQKAMDDVLKTAKAVAAD